MSKPARESARWLLGGGERQSKSICTRNRPTNRQALKSIAHENFKDQPLNLVHDNTSHFYEPAKSSLNVFLSLLRPGGVYLIEDWAWAHWQQGVEAFQQGGPPDTPIKRSH